jgi:hypothetical protein
MIIAAEEPLPPSLKRDNRFVLPQFKKRILRQAEVDLRTGTNISD